LTIVGPTGEFGAGPEQTRSGLFSTTAGGGNIATRIEGDDLRLVGQPGPDGRLALHLEDDVVLAVGLATATYCIRLLADAGGFVDCRGGTRFDVVLQRRAGPKERPGYPEAVGIPDVRPGGVFLAVMQQRAELPAGATLEDCRVAEYLPPFGSLYVSARASASKGEQRIGPIAGESFECERFSQTDGFGMLVGPLVEFDSVVGDVASVLRLADTAEFRPTPTLAFPTPTPTHTPTPLIPPCGNGVIDATSGEECDPAASVNPGCSLEQSCVCCVCLSDQETLGERTFTVRRPPSVYRSTALAGSDISAGPWLEGPLLLSAGRPDDAPSDERHCSAPLRLREDTILGFNLPVQSVVCIKLFAAGSDGFIDCDGFRPNDVDVSIDSRGAGAAGELVVETGLGDPLLAGLGAAELRIARAVTIVVPPDLPAVRTAADVCFELNYDDPFAPDQIERFDINPATISILPLFLTTGATTGRVENAIQGGPEIRLASSGEDFRCGAFSITDGQGTLVGNSPRLDDPLFGGDAMNALRIAD
jgi:hypothetical protein